MCIHRHHNVRFLQEQHKEATRALDALEEERDEARYRYNCSLYYVIVYTVIIIIIISIVIIIVLYYITLYYMNIRIISIMCIIPLSPRLQRGARPSPRRNTFF